MKKLWTAAHSLAKRVRDAGDWLVHATQPSTEVDLLKAQLFDADQAILRYDQRMTEIRVVLDRLGVPDIAKSEDSPVAGKMISVVDRVKLLAVEAETALRVLAPTYPTNAFTFAGLVAAATTLKAERDDEVGAAPYSAWSEDDGVVLWWKLPIKEPPYVGTPLDDDWPFATSETDSTPLSGCNLVWTPLVEPSGWRKNSDCGSFQIYNCEVTS